MIAGAETARKVTSGAAAEDLGSAGAEWGLNWRIEGLRVDRVVGPGTEFACGAFRVAVIDAPSHGREGLAYALLEQGVLLPGDHLSAITYPLLAGSLARAVRACERLLEELDAYAPPLGGARPLAGLAFAEARAVGEADLRTSRVLPGRRAKRAPSGFLTGTRSHVYEVEPPRTNTGDFEIYGIRAGDARRALAEIEG